MAKAIVSNIWFITLVGGVADRPDEALREEVVGVARAGREAALQPDDVPHTAVFGKREELCDSAVPVVSGHSL